MEYLAMFIFGLGLLFFCVVSAPAIIESWRIYLWRRRVRKEWRKHRSWAKRWVVR